VRHDLFPGGREAVRDRRVLDFFGNVQGVEVDSAEDESAASWQEDLRKLERFVELAKAGEEAAAAAVAAAPESPAEAAGAVKESVAAEQKQSQHRAALDMAKGGEGWMKQAVGVGSLLALGAAWFVVK
jgi:phosphatidylinositol glycan class K